MFIHDAVLESLTCGDTQIPASGLSGAIEKLKEKDRETGKTGFETQFHVCYTDSLYCLVPLKVRTYDRQMSWPFGAILVLSMHVQVCQQCIVRAWGLELENKERSRRSKARQSLSVIAILDIWYQHLLEMKLVDTSYCSC